MPLNYALENKPGKIDVKGAFALQKIAARKRSVILVVKL